MWAIIVAVIIIVIILIYFLIPSQKPLGGTPASPDPWVGVYKGTRDGTNTHTISGSPGNYIITNSWGLVIPMTTNGNIITAFGNETGTLSGRSIIWSHGNVWNRV